MAAAFCLTMASGVACRKQTTASVARLAILPFENLSGDGGLDWISAAVPPILQAQLSGQSTSVGHLLAHASDAGRVDAAELISGYFFMHGKRLRGALVVEDAATNSTRTIVADGNDVVSLIEALSSQLGLPVRAVGTRNNKALEEYGRSLREKDRTARIELLESAVKADPGFGVAWVELANRTASTEIALRALQQKTLPALERAALNFRAIAADAPVALRLKRFEELAEQYPADAKIATEMAEFATNARRLDVALRWYTKVTELNPNAPQSWNLKAYVEVFLDNYKAAYQSVARYKALAPEDPNTQDSLGEIQYMFGKFAEAEEAFKAGFSKSPSFLGGTLLRKAAWARLRLGDLKGADANFGEYIEYRKSINDPFVEQRLGIWEYLSGNPAAGKTRLEKFAADGKHPAAYAQLAVWARLEGDRTKAEQFARMAVQTLAAMPQARGAVSIAAVLSQPDAGAEVWKTRFNDQPVAAIGMLLSGHYEQASAYLEKAREKMSPLSESYWRDLHAVALYKSGKTEQSAKLLARYCLPENEEDSILLGFAYPAESEIRKVLLK